MGLIPGPAQLKDSAQVVAVAWNQSLAWELPYAVGAAITLKKKKKKKHFSRRKSERNHFQISY